jgi:uncharacterized protein YdhG (YjbR/CyaY superfamily)
MESKKRETECSSVDDYIEGFPAGPRAKLKKVRTLIRKIAPEAAESIAYGMPAYKLGGRPLVYFAGHSGHIGLYALPKAVVVFGERLAGYKTSKGTIQFPYDEELPVGLIEDILKFRLEENRGIAAERGSAKRPSGARGGGAARRGKP